MATHSSVLAWRIPGTGEPVGLLSMGLHRVGHDWSDLAATAASSPPSQHTRQAYRDAGELYPFRRSLSWNALPGKIGNSQWAHRFAVWASFVGLWAPWRQDLHLTCLFPLLHHTSHIHAHTALSLMKKNMRSVQLVLRGCTHQIVAAPCSSVGLGLVWRAVPGPLSVPASWPGPDASHATSVWDERFLPEACKTEERQSWLAPCLALASMHADTESLPFPLPHSPSLVSSRHSTEDTLIDSPCKEGT